MKGIAIILTGCMLFLSVGNLLGNFQFSGETAVIECCSDGCSGCCNADEDQQDSNEPCDTEQECPPACDCSFQYQITAITYSFIELTGAVVQSYHYGHYVNSYTFEYIDNFLQPPRFG